MYVVTKSEYIFYIVTKSKYSFYMVMKSEDIFYIVTRSKYSFYIVMKSKYIFYIVTKSKPSEDMIKLWTSGRQAFIQGIEVFEQIHDIANQALLHCNYGRLMRLCATTYTQIALHSKQQEFTRKERNHFQLVRILL